MIQLGDLTPGSLSPHFAQSSASETAGSSGSLSPAHRHTASSPPPAPSSSPATPPAAPPLRRIRHRSQRIPQAPRHQPLRRRQRRQQRSHPGIPKRLRHRLHQRLAAPAHPASVAPLAKFASSTVFPTIISTAPPPSKRPPTRTHPSLSPVNPVNVSPSDSPLPAPPA